MNKSDNNGNELEYLEGKPISVAIKIDAALNEYSQNSIEPMTISDEEDDDDYGKNKIRFKNQKLTNFFYI